MKKLVIKRVKISFFLIFIILITFVLIVLLALIPVSNIDFEERIKIEGFPFVIVDNRYAQCGKFSHDEISCYISLDGESYHFLVKNEGNNHFSLDRIIYGESTLERDIVFRNRKFKKDENLTFDVQK